MCKNVLKIVLLTAPKFQAKVPINSEVCVEEVRQLYALL